MTDRQIDWLVYLEHFKVFSLKRMLTPISISYLKVTWNDGSNRSYKALYIFGLRVARWRVGIE